MFVSGTTGDDYTTMTIAPDVASQCAQALRNIEAALREAGASLADVVRVHYPLPDAADFPDTGVAALSEVPEPGPRAMLGLGLLGRGAVARRQRRH